MGGECAAEMEREEEAIDLFEGFDEMMGEVVEGLMRSEWEVRLE